MERVGIVLLWWSSSVGGSIFTKRVLQTIHDFSVPLTFAQITTAAICMTLYYSLYGKYNRVSDISYQTLGILTILHLLGNLFTNVSIDKANVAFTHTVKATEPLFTILFSQLFTSTKESKNAPLLYLSTLPLIVGVAITSITEAQFSAIGLFTAIFSNICFALRNVWVKQTTHNSDNFQLFFHVSVGSSIMLGILQSLRSTFLFPWQYSQQQAALESPAELFWCLVLASILHFLYNIFSFSILQEVTPLTHAVINLVKRSAIIFGSMMAFSTPTTALNLIGIFITLGGGVLFSIAKMGTQSHSSSNAGELPADHKVAHTSNRKSLYIFLAVLFAFVVLFSQLSTQSNVPLDDTVELAINQQTIVDESEPPSQTTTTAGLDNQQVTQIPPEGASCSLNGTWMQFVKKQDGQLIKIDLDKVDSKIIMVFGFTAVQGSSQHFGQFGASYVIDREVRARLAEDVLVLPFPPSTNMEKMKAASPFCSLAVINFEGSFHDNSWGSKYIIEALHDFIDKSIPTYAINIAWYPTTEAEEGASLVKNSMVQYVAARDQNSYNAMKRLGIDKVHQAADLTFLLPYKFDCYVNQFFAEKNAFWSQSRKLKIVLTRDSGGATTTQKVASLIKEEYGDNVDILSILDTVLQGNRIIHVTEDSIYEALWILKNADLVITGRFHCATFARLVSVPTVMISGNTPKLKQLSEFINSPAYPYVAGSQDGLSYIQVIWNKAKEALAFSKTVNLEQDGVVDALRELANNNFPGGSHLYNWPEVTMQELQREISFSQAVKAIWSVINNSPVNYYALDFNITTQLYTTYEYPLTLS